MDPLLFSRIYDYLQNHQHYKWATAKTMIAKLGLAHLSPIELDGLLVNYYQNEERPKIRFSTLPSVKSLDVLWGSTERVGDRNVIDIYRQDGPEEDVRGVRDVIEVRDVRAKGFNLFLSYSFKDSQAVLELGRKLAGYGIYAWIAELEILRHAHINQEVIQAIRSLPLFAVFLSQNALRSSWSAKEVGFAFQNKREILGFIHAEDEWLMEAIATNNFHYGSKIRDEIFGRMFDNRPDVKLFLFPGDDDAQVQRLEGQVEVMGWEFLKNEGGKDEG